MVAKKRSTAQKKAVRQRADTSPQFPYTTEPQSLKRLLKEIPNKPKPARVTMETLKSWAVSSNNNAVSSIRVLKKLKLLTESAEPTPAYSEYMKAGTGPAVLGQHIRETYKVLFDNEHAPQDLPSEQLKSLFNIHAGGGDDAIRLQIQTFKALCEYASFGEANVFAGNGDQGAVGTPRADGSTSGLSGFPPVQIALHIHLPENKSTRDYEAIIQDIAKYIYGRDLGDA